MLGTLPLRLRPTGAIAQGQPQLDSQWPSFNGLYEAWIFDQAGRPYCLFGNTNSAVTYPAGIPGTAPTVRGNAGYTNGTTSGPYFSIVNRGGFATAFATGNDYTERFGFIVYTGGSNPFACITSTGAETNIVPFTNGTSSTLLGSAGVFGSGFTFQPVAGVFYDLTVVRIGGSPFNALWYVNGRYVATAAYSGQYSGASTTYFGFDQRFQNNWMPAAYLYHTRWLRALTPGEIFANAQPYAGLIFPSDFNIGMFSSSSPATSPPFFVPNFDPWNNKRTDPTLRTVANDQLISLIGQDRVYANPGEVPTYELKTAPRAPARKDYIKLSDIQLIGQDRFYGGPGQVTSYDNSNPIRRKNIEPISWWQNLLQSTLNIVFFPFAQLNWPNPNRRKNDINKTWIDNSKTQLIGQDVFFGAPGQTKVYDYPNPVLRKDNISKRTWIGSLVYGISTTIVLVQQAWNWNKNTSSLIFNYNLSQKTWQWVPNSFISQYVISLASKAWQWKGQSPIFSGGNFNKVRRVLQAFMVSINRFMNR